MSAEVNDIHTKEVLSTFADPPSSQPLSTFINIINNFLKFISFIFYFFFLIKDCQWLSAIGLPPSPLCQRCQHLATLPFPSFRRFLTRIFFLNIFNLNKKSFLVIHSGCIFLRAALFVRWHWTQETLGIRHEYFHMILKISGVGVTIRIDKTLTSDMTAIDRVSKIC